MNDRKAFFIKVAVRSPFFIKRNKPAEPAREISLLTDVSVQRFGGLAVVFFFVLGSAVVFEEVLLKFVVAVADGLV